MPKAQDTGSSSASELLDRLAAQAVEVIKKAGQYGKSLHGDNFYANKLATLRADATNAFRSLSTTSAGDSSAIAELMETVFSTSIDRRARIAAYRELSYHLRTTWRSTPVVQEAEGLFPLSLLSEAKRGYLVTIGRQMNGCFSAGWYDASAVMMRRLVEVAIIEAFEGKGIAAAIQDSKGEYLQLSDLMARALGETSWKLSRNTKKALPRLRDLGHQSAHGRYFCARKTDLEDHKDNVRLVVEEFLRHAGLL